MHQLVSTGVTAGDRHSEALLAYSLLCSGTASSLGTTTTAFQAAVATMRSGIANALDSMKAAVKQGHFDEVFPSLLPSATSVQIHPKPHLLRS